MQKSPFFSIIMPVYNVERYLPQAIDSVLGQDFSDFELILVDDCSPDGSGSICDHYANTDTRVQVLHLPQNVGLSFARNEGLQIVSGTYVTFMDSDDYIDKTLFSDVYASVRESDADMIVFGLQEDYCNAEDCVTESYTVQYAASIYLSDVDSVRKEAIKLEEKTLLGYAWNKFYRLDVLAKHNLRFEKVTLIEDILFNASVLPYVQKMNVLAISPYHYMKRMNGSLTAKYIGDYFALQQRRIQLLLDLYKSWNMYTDEVRSILADIYVRYIFSALQRNCDKRAEMNHRARRIWLKDLLGNDALYKELSSAFSSNSVVVRIFEFLLKKRYVFACLSLGRLIYIVKNDFPQLFSKVKQNR